MTGPAPELAHVGRRRPKTDAREKVTGRALYINDLTRPGMLFGKILYSERPHALIKKIDTSKAERLPGVKAVLTAANTPQIRVGFMRDNPVLKGRKVRSFKDEIACLAAVSEDIARQALDLIEVEYEDLPAVFDPLSALDPEAPLIHETDARGKPHKSNKLKLPWLLEAGQVETARQSAAFAVQGRYEVTWVNHCCLGVSGCLAEFDAQLNPTLHSITQIPYLAQNDFNRALAVMGLAGKTVRIVGPTIGGAFGSKLDTHVYEYLALLLAHRTRRPVKILFDREEEFRAQPPRQPAIIDVA
ncbi:MAG: xanthine dehydrogenase family protein molybdopterin-binding subunit, partial [Deltaproteobacteria bacterium]|nr:xanthine dehydrogenase family protein molybdopterin-binding subunit [Deltaproteobacteria bacterium]